MKFDMGAAWNEAMRLIAANRQVVAIVAGVFFFLPYLAFMLLFMNQMEALEAAQIANPNPEAVGAAMMEFYGQIWWVILLMVVIQAIGMLGLLALLTDRSRPTVGEALAIGGKLFLPYLGAQLVVSVVLGIIMLLPFAVGAAMSVTAGVLLGLIALVVLCYLFTKFMLVPPVIAIERQTNPLAALGRSWRLTKGNSVRLFFFIVLLLLAIVVVGGVVSMIVGLVFALFGATAALIGQAIVSGLLNAAWVVLFLAVLAAIHRQLAGPSAEAVRETFE
jgi:membrane-anchored glycerophosphoryl diester phosphodiesterase (GDPDase)